MDQEWNQNLIFLMFQNGKNYKTTKEHIINLWKKITKIWKMG